MDGVQKRFPKKAFLDTLMYAMVALSKLIYSKSIIVALIS